MEKNQQSAFLFFIASFGLGAMLIASAFAEGVAIFQGDNLIFSIVMASLAVVFFLIGRAKWE
jgi:hypothetical protein